MKALSMAISSPGLPEKFPPPLKKFSRNNAGGRSKSSPIFYRSRNAAGMIGTAQEPYSPKVTCIGQVRARKTGGGAARRRRRRCWFVKNALFLGKFSSMFYSRRRALRRILCKWVLFFKAGYCKEVDAVEDCFSVGRKIEFFDEKGRGFCSPPRNALMLTRFSMSAPYRGERIWRERGEEVSEELKKKNPVCARESRIRKESDEDSENPRNINDVGDLKGNHVDVVQLHPLIRLMRCRSEPAARTGDPTYTV